MEYSEWNTQLRRGIIEFCILTLISKRDRYGYELITSLEQWEELSITEGTLYPLLKRLKREKLIESYWKESQSGPPRKYYKLAYSGKILLKTMNGIWSKLTKGVTELIELKEVEGK